MTLDTDAAMAAQLVVPQGRHVVGPDARPGPYVVVTTKLHGGFCVSDSDRTDYKVTNTPRGWPRAL